MDAKKDNSLLKKEKRKKNTAETTNRPGRNKAFLLCISDHAIPNPVPKSNQNKFKIFTTAIKTNILEELFTSNN